MATLGPSTNQSHKNPPAWATAGAQLDTCVHVRKMLSPDVLTRSGRAFKLWQKEIGRAVGLAAACLPMIGRMGGLKDQVFAKAQLDVLARSDRTSGFWQDMASWMLGRCE